MMKEFRKVHQFNAFSCSTPVQYALTEFLPGKKTIYSWGLLAEKKRDHFLGLMKQTRFEPLPSYGSYFQLYSYAAISDENEKRLLPYG